jgi:subfamily B ATP-binding cassette protein MsbA
MKKLGNLHSQFTKGAASLNRIEEILHTPVTITDPATPKTIGRLRGDIALGGVTFAYKPGEPVLRGVTVSIPAGTVCALVGPSGAGKSTFANLVPRFYEATEGRVLVDGLDVRDLRVADLRNNIAVVSQDPVLFNDTIYSNLLLGRANATRAEVEEAARNAYAHDFIQSLPRGYESVVGERGALLSGGQKQRIALARAFLRNAPILILDEATSALDTESERAVQTALDELMKGRTTICIAHRLSTILHADMIVVLDHGKIVETGHHDELVKRGGVYQKLYELQFGA